MLAVLKVNDDIVECIKRVWSDIYDRHVNSV